MGRISIHNVDLDELDDSNYNEKVKKKLKNTKYNRDIDETVEFNTDEFKNNDINQSVSVG